MTVNIHHNAIIYPVSSEITKILTFIIARRFCFNLMYDGIQELFEKHALRNRCQSNKPPRKVNYSVMQITTSFTCSFDRLSPDIVGPVPEAGLQKLKYVLIL